MSIQDPIIEFDSAANDKDQPDNPSAQSLASRFGAEYRPSLSGVSTSAKFVELVPIGLARAFHMVGLASDGDFLSVAVSDMRGWTQTDVIGRLLGMEVRPLFAEQSQIAAAINSGYEQRSGETQELIETFETANAAQELASLQREDLLNSADRAPVIKLVNLLLFEAAQQKVSDIHLQPYEDKLVVRMRIDGILFDTFEVPKASQEEVLSRVKVLGHMDIAEKRLPQDGRATVQLGDRLIDLRIASLPASFGERIVIRLLDKTSSLYSLGEIGMGDEVLRRWRELIELEHGLILVTGPTGSGKSTTLYAALQEINTKDRNVLTLEDPIEYQLEGVSQTQVSEKKGMTFAKGLRTVLRQDPDIVMVGEIRDHETAMMSIQASLTGHLVFSTLHTNDAASAVTRLLDLGVEPYLVGSSLAGVLAQRLVRRICKHCVKLTAAGAGDLERLGISSDEFPQLAVGAGCDACRRTGYDGRIGLFELLHLNDPIRKLIQNKASATEIRNLAIEQGMHLLRSDGLRRMRSRDTTIAEVIRVTARTDL